MHNLLASQDKGVAEASQKSLDIYSVSDSHARMLYEEQESVHTFILALLAGVTLVAQLILPGIIITQLVLTTTSARQVCEGSMPVVERCVVALFFAVMLGFKGFVHYSQNDYVTYELFLRSQAVSSWFFLKVGRLLRDINLLVLIPLVTVYLFYRLPGLQYLLLNLAAAAALANIDHWAAGVFEVILVQRTGCASLVQHIRGKLLLEYLIRGNKFDPSIRRALNARHSVLGMVVKAGVAVTPGLAAVAFCLACLRA